MAFLGYLGFALAVGAIALAVWVAVTGRGRGWPAGAGVSRPPPGRRLAAADVVAALQDAGLGAIAEKTACDMQPCIALVPDREGERAEGRACGTKIGGLPDLLDPGLWPEHEGQALSFVAQVNLAEVAAVAPADALPPGGMLYFFYLEGSGWGFDPADKGNWRVVYVEKSPSGLAVHDFPEGIPEYGRFREVPVRPEAADSVPYVIERGARPSSMRRRDWHNALRVIWEYEKSRTPMHQLLGHPAPIQNDMRLECQLVSHGVYCGSAKGWRDPRAKQLAPGAADWQLLLQVDTDDDAGMMWGDCGRLYFWIREDDLGDRAFENTWMILQCS